MLQGRNPRGLIGAWLGGLLLVALTFWFSRRAPAFEELVQPVYWIVGVILVAFTGKWARSRKHRDRRTIDRRKSARREIE